MRLVFEKKESESLGEVLELYALSIVLSLLASVIILGSFGVNPIEAIIELLISPITNVYGLTNVVMKAIPLMLIGVGLAIAFKSGFWNIGAEGQMVMGMIAATGFGLFIVRGSFLDTVPPLAVLLVYVVGFLSGGAWALLPAVLKAKLKVNEVLTTLMMNYVAIYVGYFLIFGPWRGKKVHSYPVTDMLPRSCWLPVVSRSHPIHWTTLLLALASALLLKFVLERTKLGYEIKVVGSNIEAARTYGVPIGRTVVLVAFISGGLAGIAGAAEIAGVHHMLLYPDRLSGGLGFVGILVAWLGSLDPLGALAAALLIALLLTGARSLQISTGFTYAFVNMIVGIMLLSMAVVETMRRYRIRIAR